MRPILLATSVAVACCATVTAQAQSVEDLQRQIDELKAQIAELKAARTPAPTGEAQVAAAPAPAPVPTSPPVAVAAAPVVPPPWGKPPAPNWADRISLRGYTQMRVSEFISGDRDAPAGISRIRSPQDSGIGSGTNFTFRRIRLVLQGNVSDRVAFYLQPDFATAVSNQTSGERREGFLQLRDAYVDLFADREKTVRIRFGQSKVPYGWENMQSSSNRLTLDRSDGINSGVPNERDLGIVAYYTPPSVQRTWDRLAEDGQKLFGNYGAFAVGAYNGQGTNRPETNDNLMTVVMGTWPFEIGGGRVLELGGAAYRNRIQPELRSGGVSAISFADERIGVHAILYPAPIGFQAEWNWGRGPQFDRMLGAIVTRSLEGGYVQGMARVRHSPLGPFMPYARWQRYRGGWKALPNAPELDTEELELGIEFHPIAPIELTVGFAQMERREADERRLGRAEGQLIRTQLQWNY
jgi:hypothetical protein